ncbi:hypothetical protein ACF0H5_004115 [Mactra antiquata]
MAAMTMDREPEVARFIDTYKYDQEMSSRRSKFGGGTSLPLNSDGYEDKQRALRDERHRDWMVQQEKPSEPVYYRVGTPEQGFPGLGSYAKQRQENNVVRQKEYNALLRKQRQMEQQKMEERHRSPPRPVQPQGPQMDYNLAGEQARAEERRAYQNHMKAQEERYVQMHGRPVTPPGGLNIGAYDRQLKETAEEKKRQYKEMLDQQQKEHMYLRARQEPEMAVIDRNAPPQYPTNKPPPGPGYRSRDETEQQQRRRNEERHQQQMSKPAEVVKNQYYSSDDYEKFQREIQRKQSEEYKEFLAKKAGETRNREWNFDQAGVLELHGDDAVQNKQRELRAERQKEYNSYISQQGLDMPPSTAPPEPLRKSYELDNPMVHVLGRYEVFRQKLRDDRKRDFKSFMDKKKNWTPRTMVKENLMPHVASAETPLVNYMGSYDKEQVKFRLEANKDLRAYSEKRKKELRNPYDNYVYPTVAVAEKPLVAYMGSDVEKRKSNLRQERKQDYEHYKAQVASYDQKVKNPERRHEFVDTASGPFGGLFHGLGEHGNRSEMLNKERQREYNENTEHNAGKEKVTGRPNWARETLPNDTDRGRGSPMKSQPPPDQYEQMLDEKRREEASRRRYDDPEYRGRLVDSRERERDGGQRYSKY